MTHPVEVLPVRGVQGIVAPGVEDVLPVAVERQVQLNQNNTNITVNYIGGYPPYTSKKKTPTHTFCVCIAGRGEGRQVAQHPHNPQPKHDQTKGNTY